MRFVQQKLRKIFTKLISTNDFYVLNKEKIDDAYTCCMIMITITLFSLNIK